MASVFVLALLTARLRLPPIQRATRGHSMEQRSEGPSPETARAIKPKETFLGDFLRVGVVAENAHRDGMDHAGIPRDDFREGLGVGVALPPFEEGTVGFTWDHGRHLDPFYPYRPRGPANSGSRVDSF